MVFRLLKIICKEKNGSDAWTDVNAGEIASSFVSGALTTVGLGAVTKVASAGANVVVKKTAQVLGTAAVSAVASVPGTITENAVNNLLNPDSKVPVCKNVKENAENAAISGLIVSVFAKIPKNNPKTPDWYKTPIDYKETGQNTYKRVGPLPGTAQATIIETGKNIIGESASQAVGDGVTSVNNLRRQQQVGE